MNRLVNFGLIILALTISILGYLEYHTYNNVDYETVQIAARSEKVGDVWKIETNSEEFADKPGYLYGKFKNGQIAQRFATYTVPPDVMDWPYYCAKVDKPSHGLRNILELTDGVCK